MPRYTCHKQVHALKIGHIIRDGDETHSPIPLVAGSACIIPADPGYGPFSVDATYLEKHRPQVGGYYVVYRDGYKSFSPASEFEDGYKPLVKGVRMRAKLSVESVAKQRYPGENIVMTPDYSASHEDQSFSEATPSASLTILISNPDLLGKINPGDTFYLDFTPAEK